MLHSSQPDTQVEFVAEQLKRVGWVRGYRFLPGKGYRMDWLPQGANRMALLQFALRNKARIQDLMRLDSDDVVTDDAVRDFWNACVSHLQLQNDTTSIPTLVRIVESWTPHQPTDLTAG